MEKSGNLDFRALFENLPSRFLVLSPEFKILAASDAYLKLSMATREAILGKLVFDVFPDNPAEETLQSVTALRQSLERVIKTGKPDVMPKLRYDLRVPHPDGKFVERWWNPSNTPVLDENGKVSKIIHQVDDITEYIFAQSERQELLSLFMQAPAAISIVTGPKHTFELVNVPYQKLVGRTEAQLLGKPLKLAFPEVSADLEKILDDVLSTRTPFVASDFPILLDWTGSGTPTERFLNFVYAPYLNVRGEAIGVLVIAFDVTEHVQNKTRALASEKQLRLITDSLPALISYMDKDGRYRFVNKAYSSWFGLERSEIEGKTRPELLGNAETYGSIRPFEQSAFEGTSASLEITLSKPTGETIHLDAEYLPDVDPVTKQVRGIIGVGHDITQRKLALQEAVLAREEVEKLASELKDAVNSRDEFMSIASHELKTPITSLKLQLQMTKRRIEASPNQPPSAEKLAHVIDVSMKQVERLTDLVESLLDVARIRGGRIEYSFTQFNLRELIEDVLENLNEQLEGADCNVGVDVDRNLKVNWDRSRIEQVLVNLVSNAIKYAPGRPIQISATLRKNAVELFVLDHGPGIPEERQEKIFERFERATASRNISGLGLGLFIVSQIVRGHAGTVKVESAPNSGAKFLVEIPIDPMI